MPKSNENILAAYKYVKQHKISIRRAALLHGVPESTLRSKLNGKYDLDVHAGHPTALLPSQETILADHIKYMASLGYAYTPRQIIEIATNMLDKEGPKHSLTKHWFYGFMSRHSELSVKTPQKIDKCRILAHDKDIIGQYFDKLRAFMVELDILDKAEAIYNLDETAINTEHNPPRIVGVRGIRTSVITSPRSSLTTVIACGNALGNRIPPYIVYKGSRLTEDLVCNGLPGTKYAVSETGWSNTDILLDYIQNHFLKYVKTPVLLVYDGHSTHITSSVLSLARNSGIHLFVLPPHSSHITQPLDVGIFGPMKKFITSECHQYLHNNPNQIITKYHLPKIISKSYDKAMCSKNIVSAFEKCGICPLNPSRLLDVLPDPLQTTPRPIASSRQERHILRQNHSVIADKENSVSKVLSEKKERRKTIIPTCGAAVTREDFYNMVKEKENKTSSTQNKITKKQAQISSCSINNVNTNIPETQIASVTPVKPTRATFRPPLRSFQDQNTNDRSEHDPQPSTSRIPQTSVASPIPSSLDDDDDEPCCVCNKASPPGLRSQPNIKIVDWAQCQICLHWCHLEFCVPEKKNEIETSGTEFRCPHCRPKRSRKFTEES